jgi:hypothetical protein
LLGIHKTFGKGCGDTKPFEEFQKQKGSKNVDPKSHPEVSGVPPLFGVGEAL